MSVLLILLLGCGAPAEAPVAVAEPVMVPVPVAAPVPPPPEPKLPVQTPGEAPLLQMFTADDGHELAMWIKRPAKPKGVIVLLHGRTWSTIPDWDLQVEGEERSFMDVLLKRGWAVYGLDLRGYGKSPRDHTQWLDPDRAAKDLASGLRFVAEREGAVPDHVLGWSFGSLVSHQTLQREPSLARSVGLYGYPRSPGAKGPFEPDPVAPKKYRTGKKGARSDFITRDAITEKAIQAYVKACVEADPVVVDWRRIHLFNELHPKLLMIPALVINGEDDATSPPHISGKLGKMLPHPKSHRVVMPKADHAAHLEHPDDFADEVLAFIAALDAPTTPPENR